MQLTDEQFNLIKEQFKTLKDRSALLCEEVRGHRFVRRANPGRLREVALFGEGRLTRSLSVGNSSRTRRGSCAHPQLFGHDGHAGHYPLHRAGCFRLGRNVRALLSHGGHLPYKDRIQITPGYGLWTAGIGFQLGCERLGAMAIPMGPGNTEKQLQMMQDLHSTVITGTSSYALLLAEEISKRGLRDKLDLRKGVIGSERWGEKMRHRIENELGVEIFDIYGLTEIYGPGIGISCSEHHGMHIWSDYVYCEIVDPKTGEPVPDGEMGELVLTTLRKQGAPLIRYRTHDLTRIIPGDCACGLKHPRIDTLTGRTDDMVKVKGCNMFPAQIEEVIAFTDGASSEYQVMIEAIDGRDVLTVLFETPLEGEDKEQCEQELALLFKAKIGCTPEAKGVPMGELPRSAKKTKRIFDSRY